MANGIVDMGNAFEKERKRNKYRKLVFYWILRCVFVSGDLKSMRSILKIVFYSVSLASVLNSFSLSISKADLLQKFVICSELESVFLSFYYYHLTHGLFHMWLAAH